MRSASSGSGSTSCKNGVASEDGAFSTQDSISSWKLELAATASANFVLVTK